MISAYPVGVSAVTVWHRSHEFGTEASRIICLRSLTITLDTATGASLSAEQVSRSASSH